MSDTADARGWRCVVWGGSLPEPWILPAGHAHGVLMGVLGPEGSFRTGFRVPGGVLHDARDSMFGN